MSRETPQPNPGPPRPRSEQRSSPSTSGGVRSAPKTTTCPVAPAHWMSIPWTWLLPVRKKVRALFSKAQVGVPGRRIPIRRLTSNLPGRRAVLMPLPQPPTVIATSTASALARARFMRGCSHWRRRGVDDQSGAVAAEGVLVSTSYVPETIRYARPSKAGNVQHGRVRRRPFTQICSVPPPTLQWGASPVFRAPEQRRRAPEYSNRLPRRGRRDSPPEAAPSVASCAKRHSAAGAAKCSWQAYGAALDAICVIRIPVGGSRPIAWRRCRPARG